MKSNMHIHNLIAIGLMCLVILACPLALAYSIGYRPPEAYIEDLWYCRPSTHIDDRDFHYEFIIKGLDFNDDCTVDISSYLDYSKDENYEVYSNLASTFMKAFEVKDKMPTQEELIKYNEETKEHHICKFNAQERNNIYNAYKKNDKSSVVTKKRNGEVSIDISNNAMNSYDRIMYKYLSNKNICKNITKYRTETYK